MMRKKEEKGSSMSNRIRKKVPISFQASQIFFIKIKKTKKMF